MSKMLLYLILSAALLAAEFSYGSCVLYEKEVNETALYLYSYDQKSEARIDPSATFNNTKNSTIKLIIHGFQADRDHISIAPLKNAYLAKGQYVSVIVADWKPIADKPYDIARLLVTRIGRQIASILEQFLINNDISLNDVHIVGHSLGAHIAANTARYFHGNIGRITGLDPAGPLFLPTARDAITTSDAKFVDIIHTCIGILGETEPRGHADFYPNFGVPSQPGCSSLDILTAFGCSHFRAPIFLAESVLVPDAFLAFKCSPMDLFQKNQGACNARNDTSPNVFMGDSLNSNVRGLFYLETNAVPPYGKRNYALAT